MINDINSECTLSNSEVCCYIHMMGLLTLQLAELRMHYILNKTICAFRLWITKRWVVNVTKYVTLSLLSHNVMFDTLVFAHFRISKFITSRTVGGSACYKSPPRPLIRMPYQSPKTELMVPPYLSIFLIGPKVRYLHILIPTKRVRLISQASRLRSYQPINILYQTKGMAPWDFDSDKDAKINLPMV